jgi:protein-tyrosine phosphatase
VLFLCLGNICRSPLAEGVFTELVRKNGESAAFEIDSAGTSAYHAGELADPGSIRIAKSHGIDISHQRSRALTKEDLERFDFIIPMDRSNRSKLEGKLPDPRIPRVREFDPEALDSLDVPDPWGGGTTGFLDVYTMLERAMPSLLEHMKHHGPRSA